MVCWFYKLFLISIVALLAVAVTAIEVEIIEDDMTEFNKFVKTLDLKFNSAAELIKRLNNFNKVKDAIKEYATKYLGATFEINKFSLMSKEELKRFMNVTDSHPPESEEDIQSRKKRNALDNIWSSTIPTSYDFRNYGKVSHTTFLLYEGKLIKSLFVHKKTLFDCFHLN